MFNILINYFVSDGSHLIAPWDQAPLPILKPIHQGVPATIPCLVSHPNVTMTLLKNMMEIVELSPDLIYDPEEGFIVHYSNSFYTGMFLCRAMYGEASEDLTVFLDFKGNIY